MAIQNLAQFVSDTIDSPVDHTNENLNEAATILTIIANHVQNQTIVDSTVKGTQHSVYQYFSHVCALDYRSNNKTS